MGSSCGLGDSPKVNQKAVAQILGNVPVKLDYGFRARLLVAANDVSELFRVQLLG